MCVGDPVRHLQGEGERICPADQQVAGVQAQLDARALQHPVHIAAGLDHGSDVRMQHGEHTAVVRGTGEPVEIGQQRGPLGVVERRPRVVSIRACRGRQHEYIGPRCDQRVERTRDVGQRVVVGVMEYHGHEDADTSQAVRSELRGQLFGVGRQEAVGTQFGGGQPDFPHLGEHSIGVELMPPARYLAHSPGDWCACDLQGFTVTSLP